MRQRLSKVQIEERKEIYTERLSNENPFKVKLVSGKTNTTIGKSKYKNVYVTTSGYRAKLKRLKVDKHYPTEREAAIRIDTALIKNGEEPVNILKKKD